jgi:iron complex transport system permease protein
MARPTLILAGLALALALLLLLAAGWGQMAIPPAEAARIVAAKLLGRPDWLSGLAENRVLVVWEVRLPRIATAALVGAGLALAGVVFQGLLLNPLADPYTLGVSAGAAFGASLAIFFNWVALLAVPAAAFAGAILTLGAVLWLASADRSFSQQSLILAGVIVAAILAAAISFIKYLAEEQVAVIIFWLMGSLVAKTGAEAGLVLVLVLAGLAATIYLGRDLNLLALGSRSAQALGVETARVRLCLLTAASLTTAGCVAVAGIIGFVGLIVPHLMRFLLGPENRRLALASALAGADRKSTRLNSSHRLTSRMPSSA